MIDEERPTHALSVRGPPAALWDYFFNPATAPLEWGVWSRAGTGKSWGILSFIMWLAHEYPEVPGRVAICRDTRKSLTASACVTIRKILPAGHPALEGARDENRAGYHIGKWEIGLFGMAEPGHLYSTEWDLAYFMEARDISEDAWEQMTRGMRNNALYRYDAEGNLVRDEEGNYLWEGARSVLEHPFAMKMLDTNPDVPQSWMRRRAAEGKMLFPQAHVQDNPAYWNQRLGCLTLMGEANERQLDLLSGIRRRRLRDAEWCIAEGAVWPEYDSVVHGINVPRNAMGWVSRETCVELGITEFYAGVDFGIDDAGCIVVAGHTKERKLIILYVIYHSQRGLQWWTEWVMKIHDHHRLTLMFCDHNRPDWTQAFNDALGAPKDGPGTIAIKADKGRDRGREVVRRRLETRNSGPHIRFAADALLHLPDPELLRRKIPTTGYDEIEEYVWKRLSRSDDADERLPRAQETDPKCHDHFCDALRYLSIGVDYFEASPKLAEPPNLEYRKRVLALQRHLGREYRESEDIEEFMGDEEVDAMRSSAW